MKIKILGLILLLLPTCFYAQKNKECIEEVLKIEEKISIKNVNLLENVYYLNYAVTTTDWEDHTVVSNVKIYKGEEYMNFFSEQGQIYQDEKEVFLVLPIQKIVIVNSTTKEINNKQVGSDFTELRKGFLDSCEIVSCEISPQNPAIKTLELKVKNDMGGAVNIVKIIYKYDLQLGKIMSISTYYNDKYKVKKTEMVFKEVNLAYSHKLTKARKYILDKNGRLLAKFKGYEFVDNRSQKLN